MAENLQQLESQHDTGKMALIKKDDDFNLAVQEAVKRELARPVISNAWKKHLTIQKVKQLSPDATNLEIEIFIRQCEDWGLNPFVKQVHLVKYKGKPAYPVIAYDEYIKRAEQTGQLKGWIVKTQNEDDKSNLTATVTIYRKDWDIAFEHTVYFQEVCVRKYDGTLAATWRKSPIFMAKKVAISQGFRLCFPSDLRDLPYTDAEMPVAADEGFYSEKKPTVTAGKNTPNKAEPPKPQAVKKPAQKGEQQKSASAQTPKQEPKEVKKFDYSKAKAAIRAVFDEIIKRDGKGDHTFFVNHIIRDAIQHDPDSALYLVKDFEDIPADREFCKKLYRLAMNFKEKTGRVPSSSPY